MKKILKYGLILISIFIGLTYISLYSTSSKSANCLILTAPEVDKIDFRKHDSVLIAASNQYEANEFKKWMQGEHYRDAWSAPVKVPVVFLDTLKGGMRIIEEGGGMQTHSLEIENPKGIRYTLRSVNKDPSKLVPSFIETIGMENIVIDGISAQHPYGALVVAQLADAADIIHTNPKLVFIPKQRVLDTLNNKYGNRIFLLEYESEGDGNWTRLQDVEKLIDTEDLQELKLELKDALKINTNALARARLFDIMVGDWDRHAKQWGWALQKDGLGYTAIPIPADRDNAFFRFDGIIPNLVSNTLTDDKLRPFEEEVDFLPGLIGRFDEYFFRDVSTEIFRKQALHLQEQLSNEVIYKAVQSWPASVYNLHGEEIAEKIISRRDDLLQYAESFIKIIHERPPSLAPLAGTDDKPSHSTLYHCFSCS